MRCLGEVPSWVVVVFSRVCMVIMNKMTTVVDYVKINTMEPADYAAHLNFRPDPESVDRDFMKFFKKNTGYNSASSQGNKQICEVCGQSGSECKGHPIIMDLSKDGIWYLNEFGVKVIQDLTSLICRKCKTIIYRDDNPSSSFDQLIKTKIPDSMRRCACVGQKPETFIVSEEKVSEKDKEYEWRNGRRHQKMAAKLVLNHGSGGSVGTLRRLILDVINNKVEQEVSEYNGRVPDRSKNELERIGLKPEYIIGLFYDKMVLQPACIHPMTFKRGIHSGVDETSSMMEVYSNIFVQSIMGNTSEIQKIQRELSIGPKNGRFSGVHSHIAAADGKDGTYRGIAQAKRSKDTARAVLAPDAQGHTGQITAPIFITNNLQSKYVVSEHNKYNLQRKVGREVTHFVIPMEKSTLNGREMYKKISVGTELALGDKVLKNIEDGEHVLFNRHPTLHRHSMTSSRCNSSEEPVIKLHESNTQGHNADFDGDEGNIFLGTEYDSRIDLQKIAAEYNFFGGRSGEPVVGITYNGIVGAYKLSENNNIPENIFELLVDIITEKDTYKESSHIKRHIVNVQYYKDKAKKHQIPYHSGRILASMLLPKGLFYERKKKVTVNFCLENSLETRSAQNWNKAATHVSIVSKLIPIKMKGNKATFDFEDNNYSIECFKLAPGEPIIVKNTDVESVKVVSNNLLEVEYITGAKDNVPFSLVGDRKIRFKIGEKEIELGFPQTGTSQEMNVPDVVVEDGIMLRGKLNATDVSKKLVTEISLIGGIKACRFFIDRGYAMFSKYIDIFGLTISARDYVKLGQDRDEVLPHNFEEIMNKLNSEVQILEKNKNSVTPATAERIENEIVRKLDGGTNIVEKVFIEGPYSQTDYAAISYGSLARGSAANVRTGAGMVGQMFTVNQRYNEKYSRASYYADPYSTSIYDRSFIARSYAQGLRPPEVMQVADPARTQALNTYLGVPESGKAAREAELHQDGIHVGHTLSLMGRDGKIMDFLAGYGCNGVHVTYRKTPLGMIESPVDPIAVLRKIRSKRSAPVN
jgi:DNA-directed RNA polymerase beta' subunit